MKVKLRRRLIGRGAVVKVRLPEGAHRLRLDDEIAAGRIWPQLAAVGGAMPREADRVVVTSPTEGELPEVLRKGAWVVIFHRSKSPAVEVLFFAEGSRLTRDEFVVEELLPATWTSYAPLASAIPD